MTKVLEKAIAETTSPLRSSRSTKITGISVIFDWGIQDRGESAGLYSQADIVETYGIRASEELDYENVRTHFVDTRKAPIRDENQRLDEVPPGYVPVFLSCDWHTRAPRTTNASQIEFCGESLYKLADAICFSLSEWGRCYIWDHRVMRPIAVPGERDFIRIKPFALNGPHADEYVKRLDKLGEDIGRAIGGYLKETGQGLRK